MNKKLINCKDCNKEVSKKAKKCPECGVSNPATPNIGTAKGFLIIIIMSILLVTCMANMGDDKPSAPAKPLTAEEKRTELIEKHFSAWSGSHRGLESLVKTNLNDPESYEHINTKYWDRGETLRVRMEYRARNGFGGMVVGYVLADVDLKGNVIKVVEQG